MIPQAHLAFPAVASASVTVAEAASGASWQAVLINGCVTLGVALISAFVANQAKKNPTKTRRPRAKKTGDSQP